MNLRSLIVAALSTVAINPAAQARDICTAVGDAATGKVIIQRGDCAGQVTPASTFKIAISLMGYDSGFLQDTHTPLLPFREGYIDWRESWRHPTDPDKWMRESVVWYSQQVTQSLGKERFAAYTKRFQFGNADVSGDAENDGLTLSWINSSLKISPLEQLTFLTKVVNRRLGVSQRAYDATAELTKYPHSPTGWDLHGKTGAAAGWGWYVGWASKGLRTFVFARLIQKDDTQPKDIPAGILARDAFIAEFETIVAPLAK